MKKQLLTFFLWCVSFASQSQNFEWAIRFSGDGNKNGGNSYYQNATKIITEKESGNIIVAGNFQGNAAFDSTTTLTSYKGRDMFIAKLTPHGGLLWVRSLKGSSSGDEPECITTDGIGNVYLTGTFNDTLDADPGTSEYRLVSKNPGDIFLIKLDSSGNLVRACSIGGNNSFKKPLSVIADEGGTIFLAGNYTGTIDVAPDTPVYNITSSGNSDIFVVRLNSDWSLNWCKGIGATGNENMYSMIKANNSLMLTGRSDGTVDVDPDSGVFNLSSGGYFLTKWNTDGNFIFARKLGAPVYSLTTDADKNIHTVGVFSDTVDFDPDTTLLTMVGLKGKPAGFMMMLDSNGWFKRVNPFISSHLCDVNQIHVDKMGNSTITGNMWGEMYLGKDSTGYFSSAALVTGFIARFSAGGTFKWVKSLSSSDNINASTMDESGNIYTCGRYSFNADFDPNEGVYHLPVSFEDMYVWKLRPCIDFNITMQPLGLSCTTTDSHTMLVTQSSDVRNSFRWQQYSDTGFFNLTEPAYSGINNDTLFISYPLPGKYKFRCIVADGACKLVSDTVEIDVVCGRNIVVNPANVSFIPGEAGMLSLNTLHPLSSFRWQTNSGTGFTDIQNAIKFQGSTNDSLVIKKAVTDDSGYAFRCIVTHSSCSDTSEIATVIVVCPALIIKQPISHKVIKGAATQLITRSSFPAIFTWEKDSGGIFKGLNEDNNYSGTGNDTLVINSFNDTGEVKFRCIVSYFDCTDTSNSASVSPDIVNGLVQLNLTDGIVYPNPANDYIIIANSFLERSTHYQLTDSFGKDVLNFFLDGEELRIDVSMLSPGLYFLYSEGKAYKLFIQ